MIPASGPPLALIENLERALLSGSPGLVYSERRPSGLGGGNFCTQPVLRSAHVGPRVVSRELDHSFIDPGTLGDLQADVVLAKAR